MAQERFRLLLGAFLAFTALAAYPAGTDLKTPQTPWGHLSGEDRQVLAPLEPEWNTLPGYQQKRLMSAARQFPKMQPVQRERFKERIHDWAGMSSEQRKSARETFKGLQRLPPSKQHELRERWLEKKSAPAREPEPSTDRR